LLDSLANYLRESAFYTLLSTLPLPDLTNPTSTTTFEAQVAIHDGLNVLEEMISITETLEEDIYKREVEKRRTRLGASSPDQLKKEVFRDISDNSQVQLMPFLTDNVDQFQLAPLPLHSCSELCKHVG
jgi:superkiller protein 3